MSQSNARRLVKNPTTWVVRLWRISSSKISVRLFVFAFLLPAALITLFFYNLMTFVSGTEINPSTWQIRTFSFRRDPFTGRQLSGITHDNSLITVSFPPDLTKLQSITTGTSNRWDLVSITTGSGVLQPGPAMILIKYLEPMDANGNSFWIEWAKTEGEKSGLLWRSVHELILADLYWQLPSFFELALKPFSVADFQSEITRSLVAALAEQAEQLDSQGLGTRASEIARQGLLYGFDPRLQAIIDRQDSRLP